MLHAEDIVALARDAARYRFMRENNAYSICLFSLHVAPGIYAGDRMDEVIDADLERKKEQE